MNDAPDRARWHEVRRALGSAACVCALALTTACTSVVRIASPTRPGGGACDASGLWEIQTSGSDVAPMLRFLLVANKEHRGYDARSPDGKVFGALNVRDEAGACLVRLEETDSVASSHYVRLDSATYILREKGGVVIGTVAMSGGIFDTFEEEASSGPDYSETRQIHGTRRSLIRTDTQFDKDAASAQFAAMWPTIRNNCQFLATARPGSVWVHVVVSARGGVEDVSVNGENQRAAQCSEYMDRYLEELKNYPINTSGETQILELTLPANANKTE